MEPKFLLTTTVIDFDAVQGAGAIGTDATGYLAQFGVSVSGATPLIYDSTQLVQNGTQFTVPTSPPNFLGAGTQASMTFSFQTALTSFGFSRIGWVKSNVFGWSIPEWTATAFDSHGNQVGQVGEPFLPTPSAPSIPSEEFTINASEIASVTFTSTGFNLGGWDSINVDDFRLECPGFDPVEIDVRPRPINLQQRGVTPVAVFTTGMFAYVFKR